MHYKLNRLSMLISALFVVSSPAVYAADTTEVGNIVVQGESGEATATGLIQAEESPKARSAVNRNYIEEKSPTSNPYQLLDLMPGVSTSDQDGTGLFGGNIRVRGFNSDQLGFTVNGAPVNDSGSFSVYPQQFTDAENLCEVFVTQGSADTEAPHVGATGGNIGLTTCAPDAKRAFRVAVTGGSNNMKKGFVRINSGKLLDDRLSFMLSYSKTTADKFKGEGGAEREHIDFSSKFDLGSGSYIDAGFMYNKSFNHNYRKLSKADIAQYGNNLDFHGTPPVHMPGGAGAQNDATYAPNVANDVKNYYGYNVNPFKNWLATMNAHFQLSPTFSADVSPYMWYGFGHGGSQLQTLREGDSGTLQGGGVVDLNGDGDTLDTVYAYNASRTKTFRPGVTIKFNQQIGNHRLMYGYWYERARHQQTSPYATIDSNGNSSDFWLDNPDTWMKNQNGTYAQYRDTNTISTGKSAFIQDSIMMLQDKLNLQLGARYSSIDRDFTNYANKGSFAGADYKVKKSYSEFLPSLGIKYQLTPEDSVFFNATKNFKAPGNFSYFGLLKNGTYVNGVMTGESLNPVSVNKETSWNYDIGYRHATGKWAFSSSVFYIDYRDRIAKSYDADSGFSTNYNVGNVTSKGFELESGYAVTNRLSVYGSLSYIKSTMKDDLLWTKTATLPTANKEMPDVPNWLSGLNLKYKGNNWYVFAEAKYTGNRYTTLVNDDSLGGYTLFNLGGGYTLPSTSWMQKPTIRFNVYNLFNKDYLTMSSSSGSQLSTNAYAVAGVSGSTPTFYVGAPRSFNITLSADF
jgi:iron complex outermembrane receptor protein